VNTGAPWPASDEAWWRVQRMQTKLHQWALDGPNRRFMDLFNLVYDPAFLVVAWERVRVIGEHEPLVSMGEASLHRIRRASARRAAR